MNESTHTWYPRSVCNTCVAPISFRLDTAGDTETEYIVIDQGNDHVWIELDDALEFARDLAAYCRLKVGR
jgi:hypothetical protein